MSWLHTSIPLYQFLILLTVYVFYKEFLKLLLKSTFKLIRRKINDRRESALQAPADSVLHDDALLGQSKTTDSLP